MTDREDYIVARLNSLERQNRSLRLTVLLISCMTVGFLVVGQAGGERPVSAAKTVRAQSFTVVDGDGKERGSLSVKKGLIVLELLDRQRRVRFQQGVRNDGTPYIGLFGSNEVLRATLGVGQDDRPGIGLWGNDGKSIWAAPSGGK